MSSTGWRPLAVTSKAVRGEYGHEAVRLSGITFFALVGARSFPKLCLKLTVRHKNRCSIKPEQRYASRKN